MNIWVDLTNSPHVNFFKDMMKELQVDHKVVLTCRPLANTIELLDLCQLPYTVIGKHYGHNLIKKICGFPLRIIQLYRFLRAKRVDVAISHSSFYSPFVAKLIGAPCIYLNDNEHAAGNRISFIFADRILVPEFLNNRKIQRQWGKLYKVIKYPGLKEGIYLWKYNERNASCIHMDKSQDKKTIYIRPEPLTAQYYKGQQNFMDDLLVGLPPHVRVVMLPRTVDQKAYYRQKKFKHIHIPKQSIDLADFIKTCDLFIGAGGTMTREAAVLGIPTISIYQDELLDVDQYLINEGCMVHHRKITAELVLKYLAQSERKAPNKILMQKGESAYHLIKNLLLNRANPPYNDRA
jgi:hypothetical protein